MLKSFFSEEQDCYVAYAVISSLNMDKTKSVIVVNSGKEYETKCKIISNGQS